MMKNYEFVPASITEMEKDKTLSHFLADDFSVEKYLKAVLRKGHQSDIAVHQVAKLSKILQTLDTDIEYLVSENEDEMMKQLEAVRDLEIVLSVVQSNIKEVEENYETTQLEIQRPLKIFEEGVNSLSTTHEAANLLRFISRFLSLIQRLKQDWPNENNNLDPKNPPKSDISKVAQLVQEIQNLVQLHDLSGIEIVEKEKKWINQTNSVLKTVAQNNLRDGMKMLNQTQIATSLHAFFHLGCLSSEIHQILALMQQSTLSIIHDTLEGHPDKSTLAGGGGSGGVGSVGSVGKKDKNSTLVASKQAKTILWQKIERMYTSLKKECQEIHILHLVFSKTMDTASRTKLLTIHLNNGGKQIDLTYWRGLSELLRSELDNSFDESEFLSQTFTEEFPRLKSLHDQFIEHICSADRLASSFSQEDIQLMKNVLSHIERRKLEEEKK
eukprot:c19200_g1_i1.p1 GENE.c19200_g1_i1~~c19200_g1_i1.p1  ORF type:complete len:448 (-),score=170.18 c19200_g1_i1:14-1336(-)